MGIRFCGLFISMAQITGAPSAPVTSTLNELCGLVQLNSVTVPSMVTLFVMSNMAPE